MAERGFAGPMRGRLGRMTMTWTCVGSLPAEVLLHRGLGRRALGIDSVLAIMQMIAFLCLFGFFFANGPHNGHPYYDPTPLAYYLMLFVFALVGARSAMWRRERRGEIEHSRYNGFPSLLPRRLAKLERVFKLIVEPALVLMLGRKLWAWNMPLGFYVCFNAFCMCWGNLISWRFEGRRTLDTRDAMIEQRMHARSLQGFTNRF